MLLQRTVQEEYILCSHKQHLVLIYPCFIIPMHMSHHKLELLLVQSKVDMASQQQYMLFMVYMHQPCQQPIMQQWHIFSTHRQQ